MTTFLMIRHGQSEANLDSIFAGHYDAPLTELGLRQARVTAEYIKDNYNVDKVYASDLKRAFSTGKALSDLLGIEIVPEADLREIYAGDWEGVPFSEIKENYPQVFGNWFEDIASCRCPNGESVTELGERVFSCFKRIAEDDPNKTVAIATHATPIRALQALVTYGSLSNMKDLTWVSNASVSVLTYDGEWRFTEVSHDEHLKELVTALPKDI